MRRLAVIALAVTLATGRTYAASQDAIDQEADRLAGLILDRMLASHARVMSVADRIRISAAPYCGGEVGAVLGVYVANKKSFMEIVPRDHAFEENVQRVATARFALDGRTHVLIALPGLPAAVAGMQVGDVITHVNGREVDRRDHFYGLRTKDAAAPIQIRVEREGEPVELLVPVELGCALPAQSWFGSSINAMATRFGKYTGTYVYYGMLDFAPSDDDLAVVLGHELAHLILDNGGTKRTEAEADYLGVYLAARAGFAVSGAPDFWTRMGRANPYDTIERGYYAHPTSAERIVELSAALSEIAATGKTGAALEAPELKLVLDRPVVDAATTEATTKRLRADTLADTRLLRERLLRISYALRTGAVSLCGEEVAPVLGASIARSYDVGVTAREGVEEIFGLVDQPKVLAVLPGSPAAVGGLAPGDVVLRVDGESVSKTQSIYNALRENRDRAPVISVSRDGAEVDVALPLVVGCQQEALLVMRSSFDTNADRNGEEMLIPSGLLQFTADDDDVAFALAHQLAHHLQNKTQTTKAADELPADRLALQLMMRAGFDASGVPALLERMVQYDPNDLYFVPAGAYGNRYSHGAIAERLLTLREAD